MIEHKCEYCGCIKQYKSPSLVKRFCSHKCSNNWKWKNIRKHAEYSEIICKNCGNKFSIKKSSEKVRAKKYPASFCCRECYVQYVQPEQKQCPNCKIMFTPRRSRQVFCSKRCVYEDKIKTGRCKRSGYWYENGYKVLYNNGNSIKEHIAVMEEHIKRKLLPNEVVHHIDGNKLNNNINNLLLLTPSEHAKLHRELEKLYGKRFFGRD